jgi:hypothetical protein
MGIDSPRGRDERQGGGQPVSPLLTVLARAAALPYFLRRHVEEETVGFAQDMARKLATAA